jgi:cardiolipin synthase
VNGPNALSLSRIVLSLPIAWAILEGRPAIAGVLTLVALGTDFLDGALARRGGSSTDLGRILDPLADKVLVAAMLVALVAANRVPAELALVVVGRDVALVLFGWLRSKETGEVPRAEAAGKLAFGVLGVYLAGEIAGIAWPRWAPLFVGATYLLGAAPYLRRLPRLPVRSIVKGER